MSQSRSQSLAEAVANVVTGYGLAVLVQLSLFPAFGLALGLADSLRIGSVFTLVSLVRGYVLRRLFARFSMRGAA